MRAPRPFDPITIRSLQDPAGLQINEVAKIWGRLVERLDRNYDKHFKILLYFPENYVQF
jgi:hypothetical protein